jgi:hypothetical protein
MRSSSAVRQNCTLRRWASSSRVAIGAAQAVGARFPGISPGRARAIVSWLPRQRTALSLTVDADIASGEQEGVRE